MTTHEIILLCSSLQGVGRCIPLCLVLGFATVVPFGDLGTLTYRLKHAAACRSMLQHSKFFWGTVGACPQPIGWTTNPPEHGYTPGRTKQHTHSSFMAPPGCPCYNERLFAASC